MGSASSSCRGVRLWNSNLVARSQASCCRAAESTGALVENAGSDSDTSRTTKTIEPCRPRLLQCASVIPRHATQKNDAKGGSVATRSVFPSLHPDARVGDREEKRCHMSM